MGKFYERLGEELALYVRQTAWLNAVPEGQTESRMKMLGDAIELPECKAKHLIDYLFQIGPTMAGAMGNVSLSHSEINAWQQNTGIELNHWEGKMMRFLSIEYLGQIKESSQKDCPAPYGKATPVITSSTLRQTIRKMADL